MLSQFTIFDNNIKSIKELSDLYDFLTGTLKVPFNFDDILRSKIVYGVSAFDKLMHDLVRVGMVETFSGRRLPTDKYLTYQISLESHVQITSATIPPKEYWFENSIVQKHKLLAFQDPFKVADALSLIWNEKHKWQTISGTLGMIEKDVTTRLKTIVDRRNIIVHEADINPATGIKFPITKTEAEESVGFLYNIGTTIYNCVH